MPFLKPKAAAVDPEAMSADELWSYCLLEYNSRNPFARFLVDNFFRKLARVSRYLRPRDRLLEAGCGAGMSSLRILSFLNGQHFEASELDSRYVEKLWQSDFPIPVSQESVYALQRADREFDCVFLLEVLEHLEDPAKAVRELFRVSSRLVVISVPHEPWWCVLNFLRGRYWSRWGNTPGHIHHWTPWRMRELLAPYGKVVEVMFPVPWMIFVVEKEQ